MSMFRENRLIFYTLDQINASRKSAGASTEPARYNSRAAEANASLQAQAHQAAVKQNQQTGVVGSYNAADIRREQMASGSNPSASFLNEQQNTYANQAAGLNTSLDTRTGVVSAAGKGEIEQSAIDRLREAGFDDNQIRERMMSLQPQIQSTISNTGLGGSFDERGMYVPPPDGRETVLNNRQQQLNQVKGYDQVPIYNKDGYLVGYSYQENPQKTAELRAQKEQQFALLDTYDQNVQKREDERQKTREASVASAEQLRLGEEQKVLDAETRKAQAGNQMKSTMRKTALDQFIATLSPEEQKLMEPYRIMLDMQNSVLDSLVGDAQDLRDQGSALADIIADGQQSILDAYEKTAEQDRADAKAFLDEQKKVAEENLQAQRDRALAEEQWNTQRQTRQAEADKAKMLEDMAAGAALSGTAFSSNALQAMSRAEQQANQAIQDLQTESAFRRTDINIAFTTAYSGIQQTYAKGLFDAMKEYRAEKQRILGLRFATEEARAKEHQRIDEQYGKTLSDIAMKKSDALGVAMKSVSDAIVAEKRAKEAEAKAELDYQRQQKDLDRRYAMQEASADRREAAAASKAETTQRNFEKKQETAERKLVYTEFGKVADLDSVKNFVTMRDGVAKAQSIMQNALNGNRFDKGVAAEIVTVLHEKGLDPSSVVREGEYLRASLGQSLADKAKKAAEMIIGGDMTGMSQELIDAFARGMEATMRSQQEQAQADYIGAFNRLVEYNAGAQYYPINPATISLPSGIAIPAWVGESFYSTGTTDFNVDWENEAGWGGGGEANFGDELSTLGRFTQTFDTPIATKEDGGMYEPSTVAAWGGIHAGVDIAVAQGSDFASLVEGEIVEIGDEAGWGGTIVIRDALGGEHRISHLSELNPNLKKGDFVPRGELLAKTGGARGTKGAGNSTGAHIDYRVRYNGQYVNPLTYNPYA